MQVYPTCGGIRGFFPDVLNLGITLFDLPSTVVEKRIKKFVAKYRSCENVICKFV